MKKEIMELFNLNKMASEEELLIRLDKIAIHVLRQWAILNGKGEERRINTIEFYVSLPEIFEDIAKSDLTSKGKGFSHGRDEQSRFLRFYVHTKKKNPLWSAPAITRGGIDITFGNNNKKSIYASFLIREIVNEDNKDSLQNVKSANTLRAILRGDEGYERLNENSEKLQWSNFEKKLLSEMNDSNIFDNSTDIKIIEKEKRDIEVWKGPRNLENASIEQRKSYFWSKNLCYSNKALNINFRKI